MDETALHRTLATHAGVVTLAQARAAGFTATMISDRVWAGRWHRVGPRTYQVAGHDFGDEARLRAVAASTDGVVHGLAAAWWHGLVARAPETPTVTVPPGSCPRPLDGVRVRRRDLDPLDVVERHGLRVTGVPLTVLEAAVAMRGGSTFLDRVLQRDTSLGALLRAHERNLGRTGSAAAGRLLAAATDPGSSAAERLLLRLLRRAGVRGARCAYPVAGYEVDVAFPLARVAVEVDGWAFHSDAVRFGRDRVRQNVLVADGWRVLRYTWHHLNDEPDRVVAEIAAAVGATSTR
ncbi:type IV toxin-antitoxin system AbiEi family antitoxin domain-containing protein [Rhodococcus aerolatus]